MRYMVIVKGNAESESGAMPEPGMLEEMGKYNEQLVNAGVMLAGEGLHPTSQGLKIKFDGDKRTVIDGPFTEAKEIVAGFWIMQVNSRDEVIEWARRIPFREGEVEIRRVFESEEFGEQVKEQEDRLREQMAAQQERS